MDSICKEVEGKSEEEVRLKILMKYLNCHLWAIFF